MFRNGSGIPREFRRAVPFFDPQIFSQKTMHRADLIETPEEQSLSLPHAGRNGRNGTAEKVKNFVIDTNVLLHDPHSLNRFENNHIFIPVEVLSELDRLANAHVDFSFESTLSGRTYVERIKRWKSAGYRIEIVYLRLASPVIALKRIAARVREGGHDVAAADVRRRFIRSWRNFEDVYRPLCDDWWLYDANVRPPALLEKHQ